MNNKIHKILSSYISKLDSSITSLPIVMDSLEVEIKKTSKKFEKFIDEKAEKILPKEGDEGKSKRFAIPIKYSKEFERQKQKIDHIAIAFDLLPKNFLVSFVSQYDSFLGDLIKEFLIARPELFNNSDKELKFKDLLTFNTMDDAKEYIIEKEIESLLRKSHNEQFEWMENKFSLPLTKGLDNWKKFIEITERRNLFVHNNGTVSNQYLKVCNDHTVDISKIKVGDTLTVNPEYLHDAYSIFYEIGFKLVHVLWRKLLPEQLEDADISIIDTTYELLAHKKYKLAIILLDFACETLKKYDSDVNRRILTINRAIAYKFSKYPEKCLAILNKDDWSATRLDFQLAISVLKDNDTEVYSLMKKIGKDNELLDEHVYSEWPLFEQYREKKEFQDTYKKIFKRELEIIEKIR